MPPVPIWQVDAFTDRPFAGNPAAVCLIEKERDASWMQSVAAEMNLSETAFVRRIDDGFELRWFTPTIEVPLCGHATLASAFAMWHAGAARADEAIRFHTKSGLLTASRDGNLIQLDFPARPVQPTTSPSGLIEALGIDPTFVGRSLDNYLVETSPAAVRFLQPDFVVLKQLADHGVIVTSPSDDPRFDFISRYFAPAAGINEDPVTGSAHCALGPYWGEQIAKNTMVAYQASARGGIVHVRLSQDRVFLGGQAILIFSGQLE